MTLDRTRPLLCFIHNADSADPPSRLRDLPDRAWEAIDLIQVRAKNLADRDLANLTRRWLDRLESLRPQVVVNDRLDVALAVGAAGVHLGRQDLPAERVRERVGRSFVIGASTHDRGELAEAQEAGADYAGLGAFFPTTTKTAVEPLDPESAGVREAIPALAIPVLAIGGITVNRVREVFDVPAVSGIAVSGAIQAARDPSRAIEDLRQALDSSWEIRAREEEEL